ncbi:MAG: YIP1 family protein [Bacteroidales bacterium]|nr:YIP1 family protein [Bacteroidales bacterium]
MSNGAFDFKLFIKESKDVLTNPKSYFSTMKTSGGMTEPLIKAVLYGAIAGAFAFIWSLFHIGAVSSIMAFMWYTIAAIVGLFIGAVILMVISSICKGSTDFEANARVIAAVMVVLPVSALLGFTSWINIYFGAIVSLVINIFSLWLLYKGLVEALKSKPELTKTVTFVLAAVIVLFMLFGLGAKKRADKFMNEFKSSDLKEMMTDIDKE